ncbi:Alpha/Beta hydrolase protein [Tricharina praecox]|uniref:Alpha/Beta hydrolase protein n=1 Tax=Tricharina praecox TaxID=43433 RepID=UPI00221F9921|nr:Alpha/Beta hydrolase protein [Tricharina praecox]KAI5845481.1 Alpha/Beta hydrolase protein [Tricharina praecox]
MYSLLLAFFTGLAAVAAAPDELQVVTTAGPVIGHYAKNGNLTIVREFLGVPYSRPPVGELRFQPPQPPTPWSDPVVAANFGASCWQSPFEVGLIRQPPPSRESEDCLTVNVWAPSKSRATNGGAAVMLWTHGGGFAWGTSETNMYNGANIVRDHEGVIVVSYNKSRLDRMREGDSYSCFSRLNLFGFPAAPGLNATQLNPGLLDVRRAVEWVWDNIANFGGDPHKITIFGESAGSAAIDAYLYFAKNDPIIRGAILQSGAITIPSGSGGEPSRFGPRTMNWNNLSAAVNCPISPAATNLECIRKLPAATLFNATARYNISFAPVADNGTIFSDTAHRLQRGNFARVSVLIGSNDQEIPGASPAAVNATLTGFTCPAAKNAAGHAKFVPTWMFRWFGDFPTYPGAPSLGPYHGTEISNIFGTFNSAIATSEQIASSKYVQAAWVAFAKNPTRGLARYGWPTYNPYRPTLVRLAVNNTAKASFAMPATYHSAC